MKKTLFDTGHFEFREWRGAFAMLDDMIENHGIENVRLVMSTHWASSGYWVEPNDESENDTEDYVYLGDEIHTFRKRLEEAMEKKESLSVPLIT